MQREVEPFAAAWQRANRDRPRRAGPLWVALGDSLSQGIGASAFDRGWVGQLRDRMRADGRGMRLVNLSVSGARTRDVLDTQVPALARLSAEVAEPDLVTLMIGSNDLMTPARPRPVARAHGPHPAPVAAGRRRDDAAESDTGRRRR